MNNVLVIAASLLVAPSNDSAVQDPPAVEQAAWTQPELERVSREIQAQIEVLRGERFKGPVAVRLATRDDLLDYMRLRIEKSTTPERIRADGDIAKLLGVFPADKDILAMQLEFLSGQVAGFYDPDSDSFSLMDSTPRDLARTVMAHELAHALDDQLYDIDGTLAKLGDDTDRVLAFQAVVEGSGTGVMNRWTAQHMASLDLRSMVDSQQQQLDSLATAPAWLWKPTLAAYLQGSAFLQRTDAWLAGQTGTVDNADIRAAFEAPPRSTEQVLHPDRYWNEATRDEPVALAFRVGALPEGWTVLRQDTLGELAVSIVTSDADERGGLSLDLGAAALMAVKFGNEIARGWGGDRLILLGAGSARALRWTTRWDSERDAAEFFGAMRVRRSELLAAARTFGAQGADVEIEYGDDPRTVELRVVAGAKLSAARKVFRAIELAP